MVDTRDILLKAAEDVTEGMWCKEFFFSGRDGAFRAKGEALFNGELTLDQALASRRCAEGSIAVATALLGGNVVNYGNAVLEVSERTDCGGLIHHNDECLPNDPFEAGQQLAELFRQTAESL